MLILYLFIRTQFSQFNNQNKFIFTTFIPNSNPHQYQNYWVICHQHFWPKMGNQKCPGIQPYPMSVYLSRAEEMPKVLAIFQPWPKQQQQDALINI